MSKDEELAGFIAVKDELLTLLDPLTEEQLNQVPFPGSWTAGQLGDHLRKSYGVADLFKGRTAPTLRPVDEKARGIDEVFLDFNLKMQSPDFIVPTKEWIPKPDLLNDLRNRTEGIIAFARDNDLSFTCLDFELPGYGALTGQEWIHFISTHTRRHVRQLGNIVDALTKA